jgi:hypothetical protein
MHRRVAGLLIAGIAVLGAIAPAASGSADTNSACIAQFTSNSEPGGVAETITGLVQEARPFGRTVPSYGTPGKPACEE